MELMVSSRDRSLPTGGDRPFLISGADDKLAKVGGVWGGVGCGKDEALARGWFVCLR